MTVPSGIYLTWLLFFAYCVIGYVVECTYCAIVDGHFSNRGFLNGPYLPIYGSGAIASLMLFGQMTNPIAIFLLGGALCCALEWVTSYTMEKLYHARWWDYSHLPLNFQGRFWAGGFVEFGIGIDLVVLVINPLIVERLEMLPQNVAIALALATFACMATDLVLTHNGAMAMRSKIDALVEETRARAEALATEHRERVAEVRANAEARVAEMHRRAESFVAEQQELVEAKTAETRQQAEAFAAEQQQKADERAAKRRALAELLAQPDTWQQALDWEMGACLRMADNRAWSLRPDLPQLNALEAAAEHFRVQLDARERRMLKAFPGLRPASYRTLAQELAERFGEDKDM